MVVSFPRGTDGLIIMFIWRYKCNMKHPNGHHPLLDPENMENYPEKRKNPENLRNPKTPVLQVLQVFRA